MVNFLFISKNKVSILIKAIYLLKRTMRNQEKHALNDLELSVLEDLRKKLAHQWDFVKLQADYQIK